MLKNGISEPELKWFLMILRNMIISDLEFQAVYEVVMGSGAVQVRLFKALSKKYDASVSVRLKRKLVDIRLKFSEFPKTLVFPEPLAVDAAQSKPVIDNQPEPMVVDVAASGSEQAEIVAVTSNQVEQDVKIEAVAVVKRKGRGKAKKQSPARSLVSVLIDDSYIKLLSKLGDKHDMNQSQLIRSALKRFLQQMS